MVCEFRQMVTRREREEFLTFPWKIYKDDPVWVPPQMPELRKRIDPKKGTFFNRGVAEFYLVERDGEAVGRFSVGIDRAANESVNKKEALIGFFECIEDYRVAEHIFQFCQQWAKEHGMETIYGPFHLDVEDAYGIVVKGWDQPQVVLCGHTPPYYLDYFERYGWELGRPDNIAMRIDLDKPRPEFEMLHNMAEKMRQSGTYSVRAADFSRWDEEIDVLHKLLNGSLAHLDGHIPWTRDAVVQLVTPFRQIADPEMLLFAVDNTTGETIGFLPATPNMNEHFQKHNGLRYWWNWLGFLLDYKKPTDCLTGKSVLMLPDYWGSGAAILMFDEMIRRIQENTTSTWIDLSLTAINNPQTPKLGRKLGAYIYRQYRIFRIKA